MYKNSEEFNWGLNSNVELISVISHELRTPLNIILGAQKLLALSLEDENSIQGGKENFLKYLTSIKSNSYRLQRIINNFIDITDFELGLCKLNLSNHDIISVIKNIVKYASHVANRKAINLMFCTNVKEKNMAFDKDKIERVLLNLLSNAIKFSERDKDIYIIFIDKGESVLLLIEDKGIGIADTKLNSIFDIFVQTDTSLTRNHEGSGIGLAIVKAFIELHKGSVSVNSKEGKGTSFLMELPANKLSEIETKYLDNDINIMQKIQIEFSDICEMDNEEGNIPYSGTLQPPAVSEVC